MNYRHAFHAGNFADVLKHALLVRLLRALQRKEKGFVFVDTHAGRGHYDLSLAAAGDTRARAPEWPGGIGRLWDRPDVPPEVGDYLGIVRDFDRSRGNLTAVPRFYPGSPRIARAAARPQDRMELWEMQAAEGAALRGDLEGERRVSVHLADGYGAFRACLPPAERRALVLVDPPFEAPGEWSAVSGALAEGLGRFPSGTYALWYPLSERAGPGDFLDSIGRAGLPALAAELVMDPAAPGLQGCGVAVINPPWRFDLEAQVIVGYLAEALSREARAQGSVRWIVDQ